VSPGLSQFGAVPPGRKVRLGSEPPVVPGHPWTTIYGITGPPCPTCDSKIWRQVWSPGRDLWLCTGPTSCGTYWSLTPGAGEAEPNSPLGQAGAAGAGIQVGEVAGAGIQTGDPASSGPPRDASECLF